LLSTINLSEFKYNASEHDFWLVIFFGTLDQDGWLTPMDTSSFKDIGFLNNISSVIPEPIIFTCIQVSMFVDFKISSAKINMRVPNLGNGLVYKKLRIWTKLKDLMNISLSRSENCKKLDLGPNWPDFLNNQA
jgi:hypothetical protein